MERFVTGLGVSALSYNIMIIINGSLYTWGENSNGQLGDGTKSTRYKYYKLENLDNVVSVSWGLSHSMAMTEDGDIYSWGNNIFGQLGDGTVLGSLTPKKINPMKNIKKIVCSYKNNSMFLTNDGDVYICGRNDKISSGSYTTPQKILNLSNIGNISCGDQYFIAINENGDVYSWGLNNSGQLGNGSTIDSSIPLKINNLKNVRTISCGYQHVLALLSCGDVYSWGNNNYGQLGNELSNSLTPQKIPNLANIVAISCGFHHSMALTRDGDVYSWGRNCDGELGIESYTCSSIPIKVNIIETVCIIVCIGYNSLVVTDNEKIFGWGYNYHGILSNGSYNSCTPQKLDLPNGIFQWSTIPKLQKSFSLEMLEMLCISNSRHLPKDMRLLIVKTILLIWRTKWFCY